MRGINNTFNPMALAIVFVFAVALVSLPAVAADVLSGGLIIMDPIDNDYITGNHTMDAIAVGTNLTNITFYYHNGSSGYVCDNLTTGTEFTCDWDTSSVADGMYNITANDSSGGFLATSYNVTVDNNPPVVTLEHPADSTTYTTPTLDLNYTAVDTIAVDSCWYNLNGAVTNLPGCTNSSLTGTEGYNTLVVYANDTTGLMGESSNITFIVDTIGPTIDLLHPVDGDNYSSATLDLNYTVSDISGVDHCWYNLNGVVTDVIGCVNTTITGTTGDNWMIFYANDTVGNTNQTSNITFLIDDVDPVLHSFSYSSILVKSGDLFDIEVNTTDNIDPNLTVSVDLLNTTNSSFGVYSLTQNGTDLYNVQFTFPVAGTGFYAINITVSDFVGNEIWFVSGYNIEVDNDAPILSNLLPSGSSTNRYPELEVDTNEISTCRFADANVSYDNMTKTFGTPDGLAHNYGLGKSDYGLYSYYVKCKDAVGNVGEGYIEFRIVKGGGGGGPSGPITYNNNLNETDITTDSNYTLEEEPEEEGITNSEYETPMETGELTTEQTEGGPAGLFIYPGEEISLTMVLMGFVILAALSSLIFRKEVAEAIDRIRWRHY